MTGRGWRRRRTWILTSIALTIVVGAFVVRALWPQDRATVVEADDALDRFRNTTTTAQAPTTTVEAAPELVLPAPGVYRYLTEGTESVDILGGATHEYPAETLLTVTTEGCGVRLRWDFLEERRDEWRLCLTRDGVELQPTGSSYHEFFENGRLEQLVCQRAVVLVPAGAPVDRQEVTCLMDGRPWDPVWQHLGEDTVEIDGVDVPALHLRMSLSIPGHHYERTTVDWWLGMDGLPLKASADKESRTDSGVIGDVLYTERFTATLAALQPLT